MKYLLNKYESMMQPHDFNNFKTYLIENYGKNCELTQDERDAIFDTWNYQQNRIDKILAGYEEVVEANRQLCIRVDQLESIVYDDCK